MNLQELFHSKGLKKTDWLVWKEGTFHLESVTPLDRRVNRETLARCYRACCEQIEQMDVSKEEASRVVRSLWIEEVEPSRPKELPRIVAEDGFLKLYGLGKPLSVDLFYRIWKRLKEPVENKTISLEPIYVEWNSPELHFHDVDATPPGLLPKLFPYFRLKKDREILKRIKEDLAQVSRLDSSEARVRLTLGILSHGAAYREIDGLELLLPSFTEKEKMVLYTCEQHLIAEGLKTVSLIPQNSDAQAIYLCQGTELWPSQPSMLGSILANFATHGSATEAYAHSWRRIHKHLRDLPGKPFVTGHSMGGSLAMQVGLYSHHLIECVYAFNPPVPNARDYDFYHQMSEKCRHNIHVITNLDDFAFWRIGSKVIGDVTLFLGKKRWRYYSVGLWDCVFLIPAFLKFMRNVRHAFPAHQNIAALYENWVSVKLTQEEIEKENIERTTRFDYLHFFPKLYDPMKNLIRRIRKIFKWGLEEEYLRNEIEILALHERDLIDTLTDENKAEIEHELKELRRQKGILIKQFLRKKGRG